MKSKDLIMQELKDNLVAAFKSTDENKIAQAFTSFAETVQTSVLDEFKAYQETQDNSILSKRGMHPLTSQEVKFYTGVISAMNAENPRQAFEGLDNAFPETVIDNVLQDIKDAHPLLSAINFTNTTALTKIIVNKEGAQLAVWGALNSAITAELSGSIGKINLTECKLSAFIPVSKDMLAVGPVWIDAYVRGILAEAIALALETAIVDGTGNNMPIGMDRDVTDGVTITGGVYPLKTAKVITNLSPAAYGEILDTLSTTPTGKARAINNLLFIVNPRDYFTKVMPATTILRPDGTYANDIFPFPTTVVQSSGAPIGKAVVGIANKYFMGIGAGTTGGKVEFSDDFKFLDDERVYLIKLYGNGRALDNNAFMLLDITGITPLVPSVAVSGIVNTKEQI